MFCKPPRSFQDSRLCSLKRIYLKALRSVCIKLWCLELFTSGHETSVGQTWVPHRCLTSFVLNLLLHNEVGVNEDSFIIIYISPLLPDNPPHESAEKQIVLEMWKKSQILLLLFVEHFNVVCCRHTVNKVILHGKVWETHQQSEIWS